MSNREPRFPRRAQADLRSIYRYSRSTWGQHQADAYRARLNEAFERIVHFPQIGTAYPELADNARRLVVAFHLVFYLVRDDGVYVVRVVHQRMDLDGIDLD